MFGCCGLADDLVDLLAPELDSPLGDHEHSHTAIEQDLITAGGILSDPLVNVVCMGEHPAAVLMAQATRLLDDAGRIPLTGFSGAELDAVIEDGSG